MKIYAGLGKGGGGKTRIPKDRISQEGGFPNDRRVIVRK